MTEESDVPASVPEEASGMTPESRYLAFCDILGFSNRILTDFDNALRVYKEFGDQVSTFTFKDVQATMYSDAILITGMSLAKVLVAVQGLCFFSLAHDLMIRGAITKGRYWEHREGNHLLVASDALVRAVRLEKSVGVPAVVIADDVEIPDSYWMARFVRGPFVTALLHFRDRNIVNPFNLFWGQSAAFRARVLMAGNLEHRDKYLWFLALHEAVATGQELIPPDVFKRFVREGTLQTEHPERPENHETV